MINKTNLVSLLSIVCAWQADLEAHEAYFSQLEEAELNPSIEHHVQIQGQPSSDSIDKILAKLHEEHIQNKDKQI